MTNFQAGVVAADVEGTLTGGVMWKAIDRFMISHGCQSERDGFIRQNRWGALKYRLGLGDRQAFRNNWIIAQARLLQGFSAEEMDMLANWVIEHDFWPKRRQAVIDEVLNWQSQGATLVLASGLYQPIVTAFARCMGRDILAIGTQLAFTSEGFSGEFSGPICNGKEKALRVADLIRDQPLLAAYGDSLSDVPMLSLSRQPVAVFPEKTLLKHAQAQGWRVIL